MTHRLSPRSRHGFASCLLLLVLVIPTMSWAQAAIRLAPDVVVGNPGDQVEVEVRVSTSTLEISLVQVSVDFDAASLRYEGVRIGSDLLAEGFFINQETVDPIWPPTTPGTNDNVVVQVYGGTSNAFTGDDLQAAVLIFTVQPGDCESSPVGLDPTCPRTEMVLLRPVVTICAPDLSLEGTTFTRSSLQVQGCARLFGPNFTDPTANPPIPGVRIGLLDGAGVLVGETLTDISGCFAFTDLAEGSYTIVASGEGLGDTGLAISGSDAVALFQAAGGGLLLHPKQVIAGDVAGRLEQDPTGTEVTVPNGILDLPDPVAVSNWLAFLRSGSDAGWTDRWTFDVSASGSSSSSFDLLCSGGTVSIPIEGILLGDVNASWPASPLKVSEESPVRFLPSEVASTNGEVLVRLDAELRGETLESVLFTLQHDANLRYLGMEAGERTQGFYAIANPAEPGKVHGALICGPAAAQESGEVVRLRFERLDPGRPASISFPRLVANDRRARVTTLWIAGSHERPRPGAGDLALRCSPNPSNPSVAISYGLPQRLSREAVSVRVYDSAGRLVRELVRARPGVGSHVVQWTGTGPSGRPVSSGVYFVKVTAGSESVLQKIVLLR